MVSCNLRQVYAETLCEIAATRKDFIALDADSREPTRIDIFTSKFPERSFSFGLGEQNMVTAAAGMATEGLVPFVNSYAAFTVLRALDQIRNSIALPNLNVKIVVSHFGLDVGVDGNTHQAIEDLAIMRSVPNISIISPADDIEMRQAVKYIVDHKGPVYLRTGKSNVIRVHTENYKFNFGKPSVLREGKDVTIFTIGVMTSRSLDAAEILKTKGVSAAVVNVSTLKPIDKVAIINMAKLNGAVLTVEDHNIYGGLGGLIAEILSTEYPLPMDRVGVPDRFGEAGKPDELYKMFEMDPESIANAAMQVMKKK